MFSVMEPRQGVVVRQSEPPAIADHPDVRRRVSAAVVDRLADLHAVDITANGLSALGKPAGFVERQVRGWTERWHGSKIAPPPAMEAAPHRRQGHPPPDAGGAAAAHPRFT